MNKLLIPAIPWNEFKWFNMVNFHVAFLKDIMSHDMVSVLEEIDIVGKTKTIRLNRIYEDTVPVSQFHIEEEEYAGKWGYVYTHIPQRESPSIYAWIFPR